MKAQDIDAARASYDRMRAQLAEIDAAIAEIEARRWHLSQDREAEIEGAARAVLAGAGAAIRDERRNLEDLTAQREVIARAAGIARAEYRAQRAAQNREIVTRLRPAHREAAIRVARAVQELAAANASEAAIRAQAPGAALPFAGFPGIDARPHTGSAWFFLRHVERTFGDRP